MNRKKKTRRNELAELRFVSSLSLEASTLLIKTMHDDVHHVKLSIISPNEVKFTFHDTVSKYTPRIIGVLRRWNDSETTIEASPEATGIYNRTRFKECDLLLQKLLETFKEKGDIEGI